MRLAISKSEFEWIGEADSGEDAVELTRRLRPDLVVVDVRMPGIGGIEAAFRIATHVPRQSCFSSPAQRSRWGVPDGTTAEILGKHELNRKSL